MKATVERLDKTRVELEIEVEPERVEESLEKAYRKVVKRVNIPGFRKGKAPRHILELRLGKGVLIEDALEILLPQVYSEAIKETNVEPVDEPKFDIISIEDDQPWKFKAEVEVKPEPILGQYKGLEIEKLEVEIADETVDKSIEQIREKFAELEKPERDTVQTGDFVIIDFEGFIDGKPFEGGAAKDYPMQVGSTQFIPGFSEQLVGHKLDEQFEIEVTFPEDYGKSDLAGKTAMFKVTVKDIKEKKLPELDDDFAKDVGDYETFEEFRASIRRRFEEEVAARANQALRLALSKKAAENAEVEVPQALVDRRARSLANDLAMGMVYRGYNFEKFLEATNTTPEQFVDQFKPRALEQVRIELVLEAIAKAEGIQVSDEELEKKIEELAAAAESPEEYKKQFDESEAAREALRESMLLEKAIDLLVDEAKITVVKKLSTDLETQANDQEETVPDSDPASEGVSAVSEEITPGEVVSGELKENQQAAE